jgi:hypothetical protein
MGDGCVDFRQSRCPSLAKTSGITDSSASALDALLAATLGVLFTPLRTWGLARERPPVDENAVAVQVGDGAAASCPAQVTKEVTAQMLFGLVLCSARPGTRVASRRGQLPCLFPPSVCNVLTTAERCRGSGHCGKNLAEPGVSRLPV